MYFVGFFGYGVFYQYTNIAFQWDQSIEILTPKIAYPLEVRGWYAILQGHYIYGFH